MSPTCEIILFTRHSFEDIDVGRRFLFSQDISHSAKATESVALPLEGDLDSLSRINC